MSLHKVLFVAGIIILVCNLIVAGFGIVFKVMHWPFSNEMLITGSGGALLGIVLLLVMVVLRAREEKD